MTQTNDGCSVPDASLKTGKGGLSTQAVHAGEDRQKYAHSVAEPIFLSSTYSFENTQAALDFVREKQPRDEYARYSNPGERSAEKKLAVLENGEEAVLFASGMSAVSALFLAKLQAGDEVVLFNECYHRTRMVCAEFLAKYGVKTHLVRACDYDGMEAMINSKTKLLMSESPTNPHHSVVDLARFAALGQKYGVETAVDATLATPYNCRPLDFGLDYVVHSCTKYLAGHNDLLCGAVIGSAKKVEQVRVVRGLLGLMNSPHNEYLFLRGLKSFEVRMRRHNENGQAVSEFLESHPRVEKVYYPGLSSHPYHELAKKQMRGFGGLVTFVLKDADAAATAAVVDAVRIPRIAPSLGGAESLIEQPLVISFHEFSAEKRREFNIPDSMIRLACGLENPEDLVADLKMALDR